MFYVALQIKIISYHLFNLIFLLVIPGVALDTTTCRDPEWTLVGILIS